MAQEKQAFGSLKNPKTILVIVLIIIFAGSATYAVMGDVSIHGLTVKIYSVSRSCTSSKVVTFSINNLQVWSTDSLQTSLTHVSFNLAADGLNVGSLNANDKSFGPGQSVSYSLTFQNPAIDPNSLPSSSHLTLSITALVSSGLYSSYVTSSDSQTENFSGQAC